MNFSIGERFGLLELVPKQGSFVTWKLIEELKGNLSPDVEEIKSCGIKQLDSGQISWGNDTNKDIEIPEIILETIVAEIKKLDASGSLQSHHVSLYGKLVEVEGPSSEDSS